MANTKMLFSLVAVAAVGGFAYVFFRKQCEGTGFADYPMVCGWMGYNAPAAAPAAGSSAPAPAASSPPANPDAAWQLALTKMKSAAGTNSLNFHQWSYYFQNGTPGAGLPTGFGQSDYITPAVFSSIVTIGGGDAMKLISAEDFIGFYRTALHNAGMSGFEIPTWLIHRGGAYA